MEMSASDAKPTVPSEVLDTRDAMNKSAFLQSMPFLLSGSAPGKAGTGSKHDS